MEMQSFVFGMLTMIGILLLVGCIVGFVKIYKHGKTLNDHEVIQTEMHKEVNDHFGKVWEEFGRMNDELRRDCNKYTDTRYDKLEQKLTKK